MKNLELLLRLFCFFVISFARSSVVVVVVCFRPDLQPVVVDPPVVLK